MIIMNKIKITIVALVSLLLTGCGGCSSNKNDTSYLDVLPYDVPIVEERKDKEPEHVRNESSIKIPYTEQYGNTITIPVKINGMKLDMIYDTGASTTTITLVEAKYLYEKGLLTKDDSIGIEKFQSADGSIHVGMSITIRKLEIGNKIRLHNIEASIISNQQAPLLLGQSVMKHFREISVDRENKVVKFFE